jgi:hypothetical protein
VVLGDYLIHALLMGSSRISEHQNDPIRIRPNKNKQSSCESTKG